MGQYKIGTVTTTNGSTVVTGDGTSWLANVSVGNGFVVSGLPLIYDVASVDSDTQITLLTPWSGETGSGKAYAIHRDFTSGGIPELSQGDIETATILTRVVRRIQTLIGAGGDSGGDVTWAEYNDGNDPLTAPEADFTDALALGDGAVAGATNAFAFLGSVSGNNGIAIGKGTQATGTGAVAIGQSSTAPASSTAVGQNVLIHTGVASAAHGLGSNIAISAPRSVACGTDITIAGQNSFGAGYDVTINANADESVAIGYQVDLLEGTIAIGDDISANSSVGINIGKGINNVGASGSNAYGRILIGTNLSYTFGSAQNIFLAGYNLSVTTGPFNSTVSIGAANTEPVMAGSNTIGTMVEAKSNGGSSYHAGKKQAQVLTAKRFLQTTDDVAQINLIGVDNAVSGSVSHCSVRAELFGVEQATGDSVYVEALFRKVSNAWQPVVFFQQERTGSLTTAGFASGPAAPVLYGEAGKTICWTMDFKVMFMDTTKF